MNSIKYIVMLTMLLLSLDTTFTATEKVNERINFIENKINEMTIEEKIGQMLMIYD